GYVKVGLVPGDGDTYFLPRLVGRPQALGLPWTAEFIEAPGALRVGVRERVVPAAALKKVTYVFAEQTATGTHIPVRMLNRLVSQSLGLDPPTRLALVSSHMGLVRQTATHAEGVAAFKENRAAYFAGR